MTNTEPIAALRAETFAGVRAAIEGEPAVWLALAEEASRRLDAMGVPEVGRA